MIIGMVLFPNLTQLDLTGPYEVFGRMPSTKSSFSFGIISACKSDYGLLLTPDATFNDCPQVDILFVPGGKGIFEAMQNKKLIGFLKQQAVKATYITSVCTGALVLATAGLLDGYKATTHWLSLDLLKLFPVEVVKQRVVVDRNRITGGGVTAGIDFGLSVAAELFGEDVAKDAQLFMEYNPAPPFNAGSPETAGKEVVEQVIASRAAIQHERAQLVKTIK